MKEVPVTFKSKGKQIVGILHLPKRKKPPIIVMCHGFTGCKLGTPFGLFVQAARYWCRNGFAVLRFDFRGCGDSEGEFEDYCFRVTLEDTKSAIKFLTTLENVDVSRVGIVGHSRGGPTAIAIAAETKIPKCLVTWNSVVDFKYFLTKDEIRKIKRKGYMLYDGFKVGKALLEDFNYNIKDYIEKLNVPSLFIHSEKDQVVNIKHSKLLFDWCKTKKKFVTIKNADHVFSNPNNRERVFKITLDWFKENL